MFPKVLVKYTWFKNSLKYISVVKTSCKNKKTFVLEDFFRKIDPEQS